jgi:hypothetical protein
MKNPVPGAVIQIALPNGKFAYGRLYRDASIGIYQEVSDVPAKPPIGSRDFRFNVGVYKDVLTSEKCAVVGEDPFVEGEDPWPPAHCIVDPISGECSIYHHGEIKPALPEECQGLETAAVWELEHIIDRILNGNDSRYLQSMRTGSPKKKSTVQ